MTNFSDQLLRPNNDSKFEWTASNASTGTSCVSEAITAPTAPSDGLFITETTVDQDARFDLTTYALGSGGRTGEVCVGFRAWAHVTTPVDRRIRWSVAAPLGTAMFYTEFIPVNSSGWFSYDFVGPLTQTQIDALQIMFDTPDVGTNPIRVDATYVQLFTSTHVWEAANNKLLGVRNPNTGLSTGAGFLGGDAFRAVQINATTVAYFMRDTYKATAAGQQQTFGTNPFNSGAPRTAFNRSGVYIQSGSLDPSAATFTYFSGAANADYFPNNAAGNVRWPQGAFIRSGRLFVVGMLETTGINPIGRWVAYCDDYAANPTDPSLWTWTFSQELGQGLSQAAVGALGIWDNSGTDGFVYLFDDGTLFTTQRPLSIYRLPAAQFQAGTNWKGGEWWDGAAWSKDKPGFMTLLPPATLGRKRPRGNSYNFTLTPPGQGTNEGSVHKRAADGKFALTSIFDAPWTWNPVVQYGTPPYHIGSALTTGTGIGKFNAPVDKYEIPAISDWCYTCQALEALTFSGKTANDVVAMYTENGGGTNNADARYYPKFARLLGV